MKILLDVSNIVYGGHYGSPERRVSGFPIGGIRKILGIVNAEVRHSDFAFCFDGTATMKKELLPQYKAGRVPNYAVAAQIALLKEILTDCNIPFYCSDEYEADDYICSLVHFFECINDPDEVVIYSDDHDVACCVTDRCSIRNATSQGICINRMNFEERVVRGQFVPYNTILVHKMMYGDKSDNYSGLSIPGLRFDLLAQSLVDGVTPFIENGQFPPTVFMDLNIMNAVIDGLPSSFTSDMKDAIKAQAKIVFPQLVDVTTQGTDAFYAGLATNTDPLFRYERKHLKIFGQGDFDQKKFDFYCSMFGLNHCRPERYGDKFSKEFDDFKALLGIRAKELSSGVMAVERYQKKRAVAAEAPMVANMQLPL